MVIPFSCTCGKKMQARVELAGKRIKCAGCQKVVKIPEQTIAKTVAPAAAALDVGCKCGKKLKVKKELAGKRIKCPSCQGVVTIPTPTPGSAKKAPPTQTISRAVVAKAAARAAAAPKSSVDTKAPVVTKAVQTTTKAPVAKRPAPAPPPQAVPPPATQRPPAKPSHDDDEDPVERRPLPWKAIGTFTVVVAVVALGAWYFLGANAGFVSGEVTFNGTALADAQMEFLREDGKLGPLRAVTNTAGKYTLHGPTRDGVPTGIYIVTVQKMATAGGNAPVIVDGTPVPDPEQPSTDSLQNILPRQYSLPDQTKLRASVGRGSNTINFALTANP